MDLAAVVVSFAAVVISCVALFRGERLQKELRKSQSEHEALQSNVSLLVALWTHIGSKPSLLRFHGITKEDLDAVDIDAQELAYLVASFEAAGDYYERFDEETGPFPRDSLRYHMCASKATQRAWPLLKCFFMGSPNYRSRIEKTIEILKQERTC